MSDTVFFHSQKIILLTLNVSDSKYRQSWSYDLAWILNKRTFVFDFDSGNQSVELPGYNVNALFFCHLHWQIFYVIIFIIIYTFIFREFRVYFYSIASISLSVVFCFQLYLSKLGILWCMWLFCMSNSNLLLCVLTVVWTFAYLVRTNKTITGFADFCYDSLVDIHWTNDERLNALGHILLQVVHKITQVV